MSGFFYFDKCYNYIGGSNLKIYCPHCHVELPSTHPKRCTHCGKPTQRPEDNIALMLMQYLREPMDFTPIA